MDNKVSIHAPWEGCDTKFARVYATIYSFNSRTLGRVRHISEVVTTALTEFQFTHPGKGATAERLVRGVERTCFNSRTLGRVRLSEDTLIMSAICFNSRTLGRVRLELFGISRLVIGFNSRTLGRVRQHAERHCERAYLVSIHAPWEGCDIILSQRTPSVFCFNSRTLGRVRPA